MRVIIALTTLTLVACGGGSEVVDGASAPSVCFGGTMYCDKSGFPVSVEHRGTNAEHVAAGRAVAEVVDGVPTAYVGRVPIGRMEDFMSICEVAVGQFSPDACE